MECRSGNKRMKNLKSFVQELEEAGRCWTGYKPVKGKKPYSPGSCVKEEDEQLEEKRGLWDNIHARRKKGLPPKKPGQKGYPKTLNIEQYEEDDGPLTDEQLEQLEEVAAWQRKEGKSESGGLNRKGIESYRRENPGSKLSMAVTTKPSKLKKGSKAANRRKSFCARMGGMKRRLTSAKTARDPDSRINKALRKWNC